MAKRAAKKVEQPGSRGFFLRIPDPILKPLQKQVDLTVPLPNGTTATKQTVIIAILAEYFEVTDELPKRGGQKKIRNSAE